MFIFPLRHYSCSCKSIILVASAVSNAKANATFVAVTIVDSPLAADTFSDQSQSANGSESIFYVHCRYISGPTNNGARGRSGVPARYEFSAAPPLASRSSYERQHLPQVAYAAPVLVTVLRLRWSRPADDANSILAPNAETKAARLALPSASISPHVSLSPTGEKSI
jgi:hypothetical protein